MTASPPADEQYCYLTTTGRVSREPREIEIWFALVDRAAYLLSGGGDRANWVRNLRQEPHAELRIGGRLLAVRAREPRAGPESERTPRAVRHVLDSGSDLSRWRDHGLLVAFDIEET
jgi:deazaflavin-dependent oxidoreductase (nitroreductase family)